MSKVHHLKLVKSKPASEFSPRPFKVHYEGGTCGHCRTVRNALVSATRHILLQGGKKATIFSDGIMIADGEQSGMQVLIKWRRGTINL
jgi:hypothetical protein